MLEFLLEPLVDTYYFGCPDSCIIPNSSTHGLLKLIFSPLVIIGVAIGVAFATLFALGRLPNLESLRSIKIRKEKPTAVEELIENVTESREPESIAELEHAIKRGDKKKFLQGKDLNPELAFDKFLAFQDPNHPQTDNLKAVRTEAKDDKKVLEEAFPIQKEITEIPEELEKETPEVVETPKVEIPEVKMSTAQEQEFYKENKDDLEKQARKITELMKSENISEDEATDRIIAEMDNEVKEVKEVKEETVEKEEKVEEEIDVDFDVFKQDIRTKTPKHFKFLHTQFKKKEKPKYKFSLTKLGSQRRNEYAKQIEVRLQEWALPMPKYAGKNQDYQIPDELVRGEIKKLALFISMCEMLADKTKTKKSYWEKVRVV